MTQEVADESIRCFGKGEFDIHFPMTFTRMLKSLQLLPYSLYFPAVKKSTKL